tara:strand:+ start:236 stop:559 length:324 start_codon:yes stop_codon:yes gene_type:complete
MTFKESVEIDEKNKKLIITVSCSKRKYAYEKKEVYSSKVESLIPESLKGKVKLSQSPKKKISNVSHSSYQLEGQWIYEILPDTPEKPKRPTRTPRRSKPQSTNQEKT